MTAYSSTRRGIRPVVALLVALTLVLVACGTFPKGPDPTVAFLDAPTGPYPTATEAIPAGVGGFGGGVIHYPVGGSGETFGAVAIAPGFLGSSANYAWMGPRLASHGFVVLLMDTLTRTDFPPSRGQQLLAALDYLVADSDAAVLIDANRLAVAGHSMGGGGALEAAAARPELKAALAFQPWHTTTSWSQIEVPTLVVGAENDAIAPVASHAEPFYDSIAADPEPEKAYLELAGAPHSASTTGHPIQARYMIVWLKRHVDNDARYEQFLCPPPGLDATISEYRDTCPTVETTAVG
jgi:dienelactone hydrolase